ncbi:hypothetical protein ACLOJK_027636 [Asimina triloba]
MTTTTRGFRSLYLLHPSMHTSHKNRKYKDSSSSPTTVHTQIRHPPAANRPPSATMAAPPCSMRPASSSRPIHYSSRRRPPQRPPSSINTRSCSHERPIQGSASPSSSRLHRTHHHGRSSPSTASNKPAAIHHTASRAVRTHHHRSPLAAPSDHEQLTA